MARARAVPRRRPLSMTSLIDVIFLLLLFFMLSSTFARFGEIELSTGGEGAAPMPEGTQMAFLRLSGEGLSLNGAPVAPEGLAEAVRALGPRPLHLVLSVAEGATAQALADAVLPLRGIKDAKLTVLE
ncbi:biopolymer transporter ExbD [Poseidonocella sp. HB161398]|uniref:biopolymer transporter ExbD n=1 Tax=Poseidonocella sp. HB161398 TaxID=2320855 RepID=UPI001F111A1A|nr:biopolymer transporter ExbD [Poseidonocella sp. HB161398]